MGMSIIRARLLLSEPELLVVLSDPAENPKQGSTSELFKQWPHKENIRKINPLEVAPRSTAHREKMGSVKKVKEKMK